MLSCFRVTSTRPSWRFVRSPLALAPSCYRSDLVDFLQTDADGYQLRLIDPYNNPTLRVRFVSFLPSPSPLLPPLTKLPPASRRVAHYSHPAGDEEEVHTFTADDPYFNMLGKFVDEAEGAEAPTAIADDDEFEILSSFDDAAKSYAL